MEFSVRKKKTPLIEESSSSTEDEKDNAGEQSCFGDEIQTNSASKVTTRSSERIQKRRNKKFQVPTKKELWEKITPAKSPGKYEQLRPRKLVNNFTKENNRYNYDPNETSGDESLDDFIVDDYECVQSSGSSGSACDSDVKTSCKRAKKSMRIRGRRHRLTVGSQMEESTSSDSDEAETESVAVENKEFGNKPKQSVTKSDQTEHCEPYSRNNDDLRDIGEQREVKSACVIESDSLEKRRNNLGVTDDEKVSDASNGSNELQLRSSRKRNRSVIESDNDSDESEIRVGCRNKHNRSIIESDSDEGVEVITENTVLKLCGNIRTVSNTHSSEADDGKIADDMTNDSGIVHESEVRSVENNRIGVDGIETESSASNTGSKLKEETHQLHLLTNCTKESSSSISMSECSDETEGDSDDSLSESDDNASEVDQDLDIDTENSRIRVRKLRKKMEKEKLFEKLRKERQRKLSKSK